MMTLECNCTQISKEEWEKKMKGSRPLSYKWLICRIKKHLPKLYYDLGLDFYNPYEEQCRVNKRYYILVHSAIEYFISKQ